MKRVIADYFGVPYEINKGKGFYLFDAKNKKKLDFVGGWCVSTVGWSNPEIAEAIKTQADRAFYALPIFRYKPQDILGGYLLKEAPNKKMSRVFRCTSGSEANEFAIRCARATTRKPTIVSIDGVYHGHTYGAASLGNACSDETQPCLPGFIKLPMPKTKVESEEVVAQFENLLKTRDDIAAFMSEPIWTNAGCYIPPEGFYQKIGALCKKYKVLLIMDEVATGIGRSGKMYASSLWGIEPDIITLAKSLTGGYATMGATLVTEHVFKKSRNGIPDYSTFGWLPQDLAAVKKNIEIVMREKLKDKANTMGSYILDSLKPLETLKKVKEVRGIGMMFAIEFTVPIAYPMAYKCYNNGILLAPANKNILFFSPALTLTKECADEGIAIIKKVCGFKK